MPARAFRSLLPLLRPPPRAGARRAARECLDRAAPDGLPEPLRPVLERSLDDPRAPSRWSTMRRWTRSIGLRGAPGACSARRRSTLLDRTSEAQRSVDERARLGRIPPRRRATTLWLEAYAIGALFRREDSAC